MVLSYPRKVTKELLIEGYKVILCYIRIFSLYSNIKIVLLSLDREDIFHCKPAHSCHLVKGAHVLKTLNSCPSVIQRVVATQLLSECILDTRQLENNTHSTTSNDTSTLRGRAEHDLGRSKLSVETVRERSVFCKGNLDQVALGIHHRLADGLNNLLGRGASDTYSSILISNNDLQCIQIDSLEIGLLLVCPPLAC